MTVYYEHDCDDGYEDHCWTCADKRMVCCYCGAWPVDVEDDDEGDL